MDSGFFLIDWLFDVFHWLVEMTNNCNSEIPGLGITWFNAVFGSGLVVIIVLHVVHLLNPIG